MTCAQASFYSKFLILFFSIILIFFFFFFKSFFIAIKKHFTILWDSILFHPMNINECARVEKNNKNQLSQSISLVNFSIIVKDVFEWFFSEVSGEKIGCFHQVWWWRQQIFIFRFVFLLLFFEKKTSQTWKFTLSGHTF